VPVVGEIIEQKKKKIASSVSGQNEHTRQARQAREASINAGKGPRSIMGDSRKWKAHEFPEVPSFVEALSGLIGFLILGSLPQPHLLKLLIHFHLHHLVLQMILESRNL